MGIDGKQRAEGFLGGPKARRADGPAKAVEGGSSHTMGMNKHTWDPMTWERLNARPARGTVRPCLEKLSRGTSDRIAGRTTCGPASARN